MFSSQFNPKYKKRRRARTKSSGGTLREELRFTSLQTGKMGVGYLLSSTSAARG